jgi:glycosyltransferase involved in cell wall biosynthesis
VDVSLPRDRVGAKAHMAATLPEILVFAPEPLDPGMPARSQRALNLARLLDAAGYPVTLALPNPEAMPETNLRITNSETRTVSGLLKRHRVVISTGTQYTVRQMNRESFVQVFDVADASFDELSAMDSPETSRLPLMIETADLLLCATPYQRDFWTGAAAALGRFTLPDSPGTTGARLGTVVPYGHSGAAPAGKGRLVKGTFAEIGEKDALFIWTSGYAPFMDPRCAISAVRGAAQINPAVKLLFLPSAAGGDLATELEQKAKDAAESEGVLGSHVFFLSGTLGEGERAAVLGEADAVICCTTDSPQTRYWASPSVAEAIGACLPLVCSAGSHLASVVDHAKLGMVMQPGNPVDVAEKMLLMADPEQRGRLRAAVENARDAFSWNNAIAPLIEYLQNLPDTPARALKPQDKGWSNTVRRAVEKFFD